MAAEAGLTPVEAGYVLVLEDYPDLKTMLRGYMPAAPLGRAARSAGEEAVRAALSQALQPLQVSSGRYRLEDELRYLIAAA